MVKKSLPDKACEVHIWKYCLRKPAPNISMTWFSNADKEAMAKRRSYPKRMQFILVYAFLKKVLAIYTHLPPDQIQLESGSNDKPFLKCEHTHPPFYFSLSYRHNYALLAISNEHDIGVDVEEIKPIEKLHPFLSDHFSKNEQRRVLAEETEQDQLSLIFTLWTMKEAFVKALSVGLSEQLKKYDLSSFLDNPIGFLKSDQSVAWRIERIPVVGNYKAALALKAKEVNARVFEYPRDSV